jgi:Dolichyl-phosphate-mannose-protein mannosyltransferase
MVMRGDPNQTDMGIAAPASRSLHAGGPRSSPRHEPSAPAPPAAVPLAPVSRSDRVPAPAWVIAAVFVAVELAVSGRYGFLQNELYFLVAGHHLAFGYVDQPPLIVLLTRITSVLGVSPTAVRIIPALAGGAAVVAAARFAALFGAGRPGRVLAALATACAPVIIDVAHLGITESLGMLAWVAVLLCVATALLRDRPRWWLGGGAAAGLGLEDNNLIVLLLMCLAVGIAVSGHRPALRTRWPWLGAGIAAVIWAPNLIWQVTHGWPQLAMASALHQEYSTRYDYLLGLPDQLEYAGLLVAPLLIAGIIMLWRTPPLRFLAVTVTLIVIYVLAWLPGKANYTEGLLPAVLAAGSVTAERWIARARHARARHARARRRRLRRGAVVAAPLLSMAISLPLVLPVLPVGDLHDLPALQLASAVKDTVGWPQLTRAVAAQDTSLIRAGRPPTSIFAGNYGEASALDVYGAPYHLPPVLSGHNAYWMWGPGQASDRTVLVVDALHQLQPYFASCRVLATYQAPYHVQNDYTGLQISLCTGPVASWRTLWPHLKHYD